MSDEIKSLPKAAPGLPRPPAHLKGLARKVWRFWAEELHMMKIDKRPDAQMLEGACVAYARAVQADAYVGEHGLFVTAKTKSVTKKGQGNEAEETTSETERQVANPAVSISTKSWILVRSFCSEFGLSPAARIRLLPNKPGAPAVDADKDFMKMLAEPRAPRATKPN